MTVNIPMANLHKTQGIVWDELMVDRPPHISVLACGARWGKDRLCLMLTIHWAYRMAISEMHRRESERLIPRVLCWYVAPTFPLLRQAWDELNDYLRDMPGVTFNKADLRAFLPFGIQVEFKSADNPDALVARGLDMVVCTEAARMKRSAWENAILTRLSSPGRGPKGKGGIAILNSTPNGRNWFWELYRQAEADTTGDMRAWTFTSYHNSGILRRMLDAHRERMPDRVFRQEYLAEFIEGGGSVFRRVHDSLVPYSYPSTASGRVTIGIDWGRYNDRTAAVAISAEGGTYRVVGHLLLNRMDYDSQMRALGVMIAKYPGAQIIAEANSLGDPLIQQLRSTTHRPVVPFTTTSASKRQIVETAATLMEQGAIALPGKDVHGVLTSQAQELTDELAQYEVKTSPSGSMTYSAPSGLHDDLVMAFCFALSGRQSARITGRLEAI